MHLISVNHTFHGVSLREFLLTFSTACASTFTSCLLLALIYLKQLRTHLNI